MDRSTPLDTILELMGGVFIFIDTSKVSESRVLIYNMSRTGLIHKVGESSCIARTYYGDPISNRFDSLTDRCAAVVFKIDAVFGFKTAIAHSGHGGSMEKYDTSFYYVKDV